MEDFNIPPQILRLPSQATRSSESRLASASDGRSLVVQVVREDEQRGYRRALTKACYDGNQPYSQQKLHQDGQSWRCNLNWRGMEGILDQARIPYYSLYSGVPTYANFKTRYQMDSPDVENWNQVMAEEFTCTCNRWKQFGWNMQASQFEMLFEGWGPVLFEDDADWRFRAIPARSLLVPQGSPSCLDKRIPFIVVLCDYRVHDLYRHIRNEQSAKDRGWNVEAVQNAIKYGTRGATGNNTDLTTQPWETWQQKYKNRELTASYTECDIIYCAHLFVQEFDGKVSHFIITRGSIANSDKDRDDFLFRDTNRYESYDQCLNVAFQNTGDGTWHSVQGIGLKSYGYEEVMNRLQCRVVDNAFLSSGMVIQTADSKSDQKMQLKVTGVATFIPPNTTFVQHRMAGDIEGPISVARLLENKLNQKIGAFNQRTLGRDDGRGEQPTATQVEMAAAKEGSLSNSQIDNYYGNLDSIYAEMVRRLLTSSDPEAKRFRDNCTSRGVPEQAMKDLEYVRANRISGYGSPQLRKMAMNEMLPIVGMLPVDGQRAWLDDYISGSQGADKVLRYNPPMDEPDINSAMATIENNLLHEGEIPQVISGMDHAIHLNIHLDDAEQRLAPLQAAIEDGQELDEASLQQAATYVDALARHSEVHLAFLEKDPFKKNLAKLFEGQLKLLASFHGKLRSEVRSAQARAAQQAKEQEAAISLGALDQAKLQSAQQTMAIDAAQAQQNMAIKQHKAQQQAAIKARQAQQKGTIDAITTAESIRLDRIKTAAEVEKKRKSSNGSNGNGSKAK